MKKVTTLSLVLLLAIGLFVTGCQKKKDAADQNEKTEAKAPAEKTAEASAEK